MIPSGTRIHLATKHVDFRKSINGLSGAVRMVLRDDPLSGHLFVFHNRSRTGIKILWWSHGGYCMFYKRLARGRFRVLSLLDLDSKTRPISPAELSAILEGIDLRRARRTKVWNPSKRV